MNENKRDIIVNKKNDVFREKKNHPVYRKKLAKKTTIYGFWCFLIY